MHTHEVRLITLVETDLLCGFKKVERAAEFSERCRKASNRLLKSVDHSFKYSKATFWAVRDASLHLKRFVFNGLV